MDDIKLSVTHSDTVKDYYGKVLKSSADKARMFREISRVLKPGGELYFSDIFSDRRIPVLTRDRTCLGGALHIEDSTGTLK